MMEYSDFIFLGENALEGITPPDFIEYIEELKNDDFLLLQNTLMSYFHIKDLSPNLPNDDIISGMLSTTEIEFKKRTLDPNFYRCHAIAIMFVIRYIFSDNTLNILKETAKNENLKFLLNSYSDILKWILLDVEDLSTLYNESIIHDTSYRSNIQNRYITPMQVHQVLRQGLYGSISLHSFVDLEPSAAIGVIRQLIELRIRRAFGTIALVDVKNNNAVIPLKMSKVFEIIKKYKDKIVFPLKFENITRIYNWSNMYIHSGRADYKWVPFYLEIILRDLSFGKMKENTWSVNNCIETTMDVINNIHDEIIKAVNEKQESRYCLLKCEPECLIKE